jgi:putative hydrolase of the HAD superfamily
MDALLIDLDDTLLDERSAAARAYSTFVEVHAAVLGSTDRDTLLERWDSVASHHWARFQRGEVSFQGQRRGRVRDFLQVQLSDQEADCAFEPYWRQYEQSWSLFPDVPHFLARTRHLPKVIVTNGERPQQMQKIQACELLDHLVAVITPSDCGYWKPDPAMFEAALQVLQIPAQSCMMIGDSLENDIGPARAMGMAFFHVDRANGRGLSEFPVHE